MTNIQQPEMRRNEKNPLVQDSKGPRPGRKRGHGGSQPDRPVPAGQASPYGPAPTRSADDDSGQRGNS